MYNGKYPLLSCSTRKTPLFRFGLSLTQDLPFRVVFAPKALLFYVPWHSARAHPHQYSFRVPRAYTICPPSFIHTPFFWLCPFPRSVFLVCQSIPSPTPHVDPLFLQGQFLRPLFRAVPIQTKKNFFLVMPAPKAPFAGCVRT